MNDLNPSRKLAARPRAGCFLALLAMAGLLFTVTQVHAQNPPTYYLQIDSSAVPGGLFQPIFVALDNSNDVYVTDTYSRVVKFDRNGNYLTQWGSYGSGNGQFDGPDGIAVDSSNNIYVIDSGNARIEKFDRNGNYLTHWGSLGGGKGLAGIAVDSSNNVYVVDSSNSRIEKFDSNGNYLTQWGSQGSGNGQFDYPNGIAVDSSNNVYVGDSYNNRIEKFTSSGTYLAQWGSIGRGNGQFQAPVGIAVDNSNNVYVTDFNNDRVEKFDNNGNYLTQWGSEGTGNGQFETPQGVAVDSSGNFIYVVDNGNLRIQVFVNNANIVPAIITQEPTNQTVPFGANVTFSVGVVGAAPFAYQWSSNSIAISSATNATFTLTNVSFANSGGTYSVLVSNIYGSVLSSNAVLTVLPTLVTTQPASGLSATGAVLNGSIILGSDETVAWFEWGTDTNYGNISGDIIVPGDNGSNSISAALTGLPGNFYHYRLDASNDFEFVYGQDQSFTVGFAPSATTLPPTNGATLEAVVNPEGWDTTVYFQWETPTLTNTTPGIEIGAGAASVNVSSFVPGLSASTTYQYQVVASNALGTAFGAVAWDPNQNHYLFSGSKTNITLRPGTYIITAYGAPSGGSYDGYGGLGAEMSAEFNFSTSTTLTLLVGGGGGGAGGGGGSFAVNGSTPLVIAGGSGGESLADISRPGGNGTVSTNGEGDLYGGFGGTNGGGGGGGEGEGGGGGGGGFLGNGGSDSEGGGGGSSFENGGGGGYYGIEGSDYGGGYGGGGGSGFYTDGYYGGGGGGGYSGGGGAGFSSGGGGSIIDSSAIAIFTEISGIASPEDPANGEIIITAVPTPLAIITTNTAFGFTDGVFGFDVSGPSGSNVVIQASTDLQTWMPLQTNLLGSGLLYFSDAQSTTNVQRFYRAQLSPAFTVGGTLTGLPAGDTVTLHNGSDNLTLSANGTFTFPTALPNGQSYSVTVSGTGGGIPTSCTLANGSGNISGANVTNVAVQSTYPALTGIMDVDMYNAAVWDGTAHGGIPGIMFTENGGPFRVTAEGPYSVAVAKTYYGWAVFTHVVGTYSCSSTTLTNGGYVIQFGTVQNCGSPPRY